MSYKKQRFVITSSSRRFEVKRRTQFALRDQKRLLSLAFLHNLFRQELFQALADLTFLNRGNFFDSRRSGREPMQSAKFQPLHPKKHHHQTKNESKIQNPP